MSCWSKFWFNFCFVNLLIQLWSCWSSFFADWNSDHLIHYLSVNLHLTKSEFNLTWTWAWHNFSHSLFILQSLRRCRWLASAPCTARLVFLSICYWIAQPRPAGRQDSRPAKANGVPTSLTKLSVRKLESFKSTSARWQARIIQTSMTCVLSKPAKC